MNDCEKLLKNESDNQKNLINQMKFWQEIQVDLGGNTASIGINLASINASLQSQRFFKTLV